MQGCCSPAWSSEAARLDSIPRLDCCKLHWVTPFCINNSNTFLEQEQVCRWWWWCCMLELIPVTGQLVFIPCQILRQNIWILEFE
ncbi:hypothetical protein CY35_15G065700 [Sphagnum magellanicum]|nr:hypothetical protein CY35_15G065700 [Sphagnum magellanicum]